MMDHISKPPPPPHPPAHCELEQAGLGVLLILEGVPRLRDEERRDTLEPQGQRKGRGARSPANPTGPGRGRGVASGGEGRRYNGQRDGKLYKHGEDLAVESEKRGESGVSAVGTPEWGKTVEIQKWRPNTERHLRMSLGSHPRPGKRL